MNKAFVKEPDTIDYRCPKCGSLGAPVGRETLEAFLAPEALTRLAPSGFYCADPTCEVAYFDQFARSVPCDSLRRPAYPKDPDAPVCGCFAFTLDDIEQDVREGVNTRCKALIAKAQSPDARCALMAADGRSCVPQVQRYFLKCRTAQQGRQSGG